MNLDVDKPPFCFTMHYHPLYINTCLYIDRFKIFGAIKAIKMIACAMLTDAAKILEKKMCKGKLYVHVTGLFN